MSGTTKDAELLDSEPHARRSTHAASTSADNRADARLLSKVSAELTEVEAELSKHSKPDLEQMKLVAEVAKLRSEQKSPARLGAILAVLLPVLTGLGALWLQRAQLNDQNASQEFSAYNTAFTMATDTTNGDARQVAGIWQLTDYWETSKSPSPFAEPGAAVRTQIRTGSDPVIAHALSTIISSDTTSRIVRLEAGDAIGAAFDGNPSPTDPHAVDLSHMLFGTHSSNESGVQHSAGRGILTQTSYLLRFDQNRFVRFPHTSAQSASFSESYFQKRDAILHAIEESKGYLANTELRDCDLGRANLANANLAGAGLQNSSLARASLEDADLTGGDLRGADLTGANLSNADITGANISGARLIDIKGVPRPYRNAGDFLADAKSRGAVVAAPPTAPSVKPATGKAQPNGSSRR